MAMSTDIMGVPRLIDLASVDLIGADLSNNGLNHIDLCGRAAEGLRLIATELRWANAGDTDLRGVEARDGLFDYVSFRRADLCGADFSRATLRHCTFDEARIDAADFTGARLVHCSFDGASLRGCRFHDATMVNCSFTNAVLEAARDFATARDLVVEILRRGACEDLEALEVVGAVALRRAWCWEHWTAYLLDRPRLLALAATIFTTYPESGCTEALAASFASE